MVSRLSKAYIKGHGGILGIFRMRSKKDSKVLRILMFILALYIFIVFGFGFFSMFTVLVVSDLDKAIFLCCIYSLIGCMSMLFSEAVDLYATGRDLDMLFSLPIPKRDVMVSRLLVLFEYTTVFTLLLMIPFAVSGALMCRAGASWYIGAIMLLLMLSAFISSFMAFFAIVIPEKLRKPLYGVCSIGFVMLLFRYGMNADAMDRAMSLLSGRVERNPISGVPLLAVAAILVPLTLLLLYLSIRGFNLKERNSSSDKVGKVEYSRHGRILTLLKLEYQGIRQSDGITFEIIGEVFIPLILIVLYAIMGIAGDLLEMLDGIMSPTMKNMMPLLVMMFSSGISAVSSTSFSREGKVSELVGTLPVERKDRIDSKIIFHMLIEVPSGLLMMAAFAFMLKIDMNAMLLSIPLLIVFNLSVSAMGLLVDGKRPYIEWSEPVESVKKNMHSIVGLALTLLDILLCFLPYMIFRNLGYLPVMLWSIALNLIAFPIFYSVLIREEAWIR